MDAVVVNLHASPDGQAYNSEDGALPHISVRRQGSGWVTMLDRHVVAEADSSEQAVADLLESFDVCAVLVS